MSNAGIDHGSMGSLRLGHVFFAEAFVLQNDRVFIAGHGPRNSYCQ